MVCWGNTRKKVLSHQPNEGNEVKSTCVDPKPPIVVPKKTMVDMPIQKSPKKIPILDGGLPNKKNPKKVLENAQDLPIMEDDLPPEKSTTKVPKDAQDMPIVEDKLLSAKSPKKVREN